MDSKRRHALKIGAATLLSGSVGGGLLLTNNPEQSVKSPDFYSSVNNSEHDSAVRDSLDKVKNFDQVFSEDVFLSAEKYTIFQSTLKRILRVKKVIGYANFNLISFDDMLLFAHRFPSIGKFKQNAFTYRTLCTIPHIVS